MARTLLIEISVGEVRAALCENGEPVEFHLARNTSPAITGARFLARVRTISKEMDAAFLDIGSAEALLPARRAGPNPAGDSLATLLPEGCLIAVEIIREADRQEKKLPVAQLTDGPGQTGQKGRAGRIGEVSSPLESILSIAAEHIKMDRHYFAEVRANHRKMGLASTLESFDEEQTLFDSWGINDRLEEVKSGTLSLLSGGKIQLEETSTASFFDVDTAGAFKALEASSAKLKINLEAAHRIAAEIRFQNLGGRVVIDFAGMTADIHRQQILACLKARFQEDPLRVECGDFSKFGLLEIRREKRGLSTGRHLMRSSKRQATTESQVLGALAEAEREARHNPATIIEMRLSKEGFDWLEANAALKAEFQERTGKKLELAYLARAK